MTYVAVLDVQGNHIAFGQIGSIEDESLGRQSFNVNLEVVLVLITAIERVELKPTVLLRAYVITVMIRARVQDTSTKWKFKSIAKYRICNSLEARSGRDLWRDTGATDSRRRSPAPSATSARQSSGMSSLAQWSVPDSCPPIAEWCGPLSRPEVGTRRRLAQCPRHLEN